MLEELTCRLSSDLNIFGDGQVVTEIPARNREAIDTSVGLLGRLSQFLRTTIADSLNVGCTEIASPRLARRLRFAQKQ